MSPPPPSCTSCSSIFLLLRQCLDKHSLSSGALQKKSPAEAQRQIQASEWGVASNTTSSRMGKHLMYL
eukprot:1161947-Pelagomonas_calceolata.AAC.3